MFMSLLIFAINSMFCNVCVLIRLISYSDTTLKESLSVSFLWFFFCLVESSLESLEPWELVSSLFWNFIFLAIRLFWFSLRTDSRLKWIPFPIPSTIFSKLKLVDYLSDESCPWKALLSLNYSKDLLELCPSISLLATGGEWSIVNSESSSWVSNLWSWITISLVFRFVFDWSCYGSTMSRVRANSMLSTVSRFLLVWFPLPSSEFSLEFIYATETSGAD